MNWRGVEGGCPEETCSLQVGGHLVIYAEASMVLGPHV